MFAPPPFLKLQGDRWLNNPNGVVNAFVTLGDEQVQQVPLETTEEDIHGIMNYLFVPDTDKRKSLCLQVKVRRMARCLRRPCRQAFYNSGRDIGTFSSKPIRIISKPSKKKMKHSMGPCDWTIDLTDEIALFSRIRVSVVRRTCRFD